MKYIFLFLSLMFLISCQKRKARLYSGIYFCDCQSVHTTNNSQENYIYSDSLEFVSVGTDITFNDEWTFSVTEMGKSAYYREEFLDGTTQSVDFDKNQVRYNKIFRSPDSTASIFCEGSKSI